MNEQEIERLVDKFEKSSLNEMQISDNNFSLSLSKPKVPLVADAPAAGGQPAAVMTPEAPADVAGDPVKSPLVGLVYLAAEPGKPVYKEVGDTVSAGDVLCLIEAMKVVNEIKSPFDGVVTKVLVDDGALVEFDQPLFEIEQVG